MLLLAKIGDYDSSRTYEYVVGLRA
jgi:hypothetical protein